MAVDTANTTSYSSGYIASNAKTTVTYSYTEVARDRDERVSLAPLDPETALRGLLITREINDDPDESASVRRSLAQPSKGEVRWLDDDETVSDATDSD